MLIYSTAREYEGGNIIAIHWVVRENYAFLAKYETSESQGHVEFIDSQ